MDEMTKLEMYLVEHEYRFIRVDDYTTPLGRHQIKVYNKKTQEREWDVICNFGSYGFPEGLLEAMGTIIKPEHEYDVEGWLTADDIIRRLESNENSTNR